MAEKKIHAFVFAYPTPGHVAPTLELAYLLSSNGLSVTFVSSEHVISRISQQREEHPQLQMVGLPDGLCKEDERSPFSHKFHESCYALQEPAEKLVGDTILADKSSTHVIIYATLLAWTPIIAKKFNLQWFPVWMASMSSFYFLTHLPTLIQKGYIPSKGGKTMALTELIDFLPLLEEFRLMDMPNVFEVPEWLLDLLLDIVKSVKESHVLLGHSFEELEGDQTQSLRDTNEALVYPVGPLLPRSCFSKQDHVSSISSNSSSSSGGDESMQCMEWLNTQRVGSVLYVAFGSLVKLSPDQLDILAKGIHASGQPFLFVTRYMINPFLHIDQYNGLIISWAPQVDVLKHPSVGAFLTHCGWNSTMEAVSSGVPLIAWPQFSEQPMNAKFIVDKWKVGIRLPLNPDGKTLAGPATVSDCITQIFSKDQGSALRLATSELSSRLLKAVHKGGSSHSNLISFIQSIRMN